MARFSLPRPLARVCSIFSYNIHSPHVLPLSLFGDVVGIFRRTIFLWIILLGISTPRLFAEKCLINCAFSMPFNWDFSSFDFQNFGISSSPLTLCLYHSSEVQWKTFNWKCLLSQWGLRNLDLEKYFIVLRKFYLDSLKKLCRTFSIKNNFICHLKIPR